MAPRTPPAAAVTGVVGTTAQTKKMTLATYIGRTLGAFRILKWERAFLAEFERTRGDVALSIARGNGKTALVAALACAVVDPRGPLHGRGYEVVAAASSFTQGKQVFSDAVELLRPQIEAGTRAEWRVQDSANFALLEHRPSGARLRCIGSDPKRMMGLRPKLVIADELASWENAKIDKALSALRTSLGKVKGSRFMAIGTRPSHPGHPFQKMLDGIGVELAITYAADDADTVTLREIAKANPSMWAMPHLRLRIRDELTQAKRDPALMASFRSLRMNAGTSELAEAHALVPRHVGAHRIWRCRSTTPVRARDRSRGDGGDERRGRVFIAPRLARNHRHPAGAPRP